MKTNVCIESLGMRVIEANFSIPPNEKGEVMFIRFISDEESIAFHSITGYSGGGKRMISDYEADDKNILLGAPRQYGISQSHKHIPEMMKITGLKRAPIFSPIVSDFYSGMEVTVPIFGSQLGKYGIEDVKALYRELYTSPLLYYTEGADEEGFLSAAKLSGKDSMSIEVHGTGERMLLVARYDNLGKGASGAAVECLNIKLGCDKTKTLEL